MNPDKRVLRALEIAAGQRMRGSAHRVIRSQRPVSGIPQSGILAARAQLTNLFGIRKMLGLKTMPVLELGMPLSVLRA
jgi:hypothetical protein